MIIHAVWDFTFLYYKYKFAMASGHMKRLTCPMEWKGAVIEKDISIIYYAIREIEKERRNLEDKGHSVVTSICFDMPSKRKEKIGGDEYKDNRQVKLNGEEIEEIEFIEKLLSEAGHNTYKYDGYEADDLVTFLAKTYNDIFDMTLIYTPDKDLAVNIDNKTGLMRYKSSQGYSLVTVNNYKDYFSAEFKCNIPYNSILLFLSTVGDKSDKVKGINKFGPKAFDKLVNNLNNVGVEWEKLGDLKELEKVIERSKEFLTEIQITDMLTSYELVKPLELDFVPPAPDKKTTYEKRVEAYEPYMFTSLYQ